MMSDDPDIRDTYQDGTARFPSDQFYFFGTVFNGEIQAHRMGMAVVSDYRPFETAVVPSESEVETSMKEFSTSDEARQRLIVKLNEDVYDSAVLDEWEITSISFIYPSDM